MLAEEPGHWERALDELLRLAPVPDDGLRARCCGRPSSAPGPPARSATGCTATPRRRRARPATGRRGPSPTRRSRRRCTPRSTRPSTTRRARRAGRPRRRASTSPAGATRSRPSCSQLTMPGRARRLPGQRAVGDLAGRPRQPPPGRLRRTARCSALDAAAAERRRRAAKLLVTSRRCACGATGPSCSPATRRSTASGSAAGARGRLRPRRRDRGRHPAAVGLAAAGGWGDTAARPARGPVARRAHRPSTPTAGSPTLLAAHPVALLVDGLTDHAARGACRRLGAAPAAGAAGVAGERARRRDDPRRRRLVGAGRAGADRTSRVDYGYLLDDDPDPRPDPRSRRQPDGVHGLSRASTVDDVRVERRRLDRPASWPASVIYELHVGTFTPEGTLDAGDRAARPPRRPRRRLRRAAAGQRLQRHAQLGLRRRALVRRARDATAGRPPTSASSTPATRAGSASSRTSSTTTSARAATTSRCSGPTSTARRATRGATWSTSTARTPARCAATSSTTR